MKVDLRKYVLLIPTWILILSSGCTTPSSAPYGDAGPSMFTGKRLGTVYYKKNADETYVGGYRKEGDSKITWLESPKGGTQQPASTDASKSADVTPTNVPPQPIKELKGALVHSLQPKELPIDSVSFSTDGKWLAVKKQGYSPKHSRYTLFTCGDGTRCGALDKQEPLFGCGSAAISLDSAAVALLSGQGNDGERISLYRMSDWSLIQSVTNSALSSCEVVGMPGGESLLLQKAEGSMTSPKSDARISLLDVSSGRCIWEMRTKGPVMAISRDGQYVACATGSPKGGPAHTQAYPVQIISVRQPTNITTFVAHKEWIASLAFSPDSRMLASAGADKVINLWSLPDGKLLHTFEGHEWTVNALRFSSDGRTLVSGSKDSTIRFWDVDRMAPMGVVSLSNVPITSIDIAPEGRTIAFGDEQGRVSVCDYTKLRELARGKHIEHPLDGK